MRRSLLALVLAACNQPAGDGPGDTRTTGADMDSGSTTPTGDTMVSVTGDAPTPVCPDGDVVLADQDDVLLHAGCADFPGDLTIAYKVHDVAPLAGIRTVAGTLTIGTLGWEGGLTTLDPLASLRSVGGLNVAMVPITDLLAFSNLTEIPGDLEIFGLDFPSLEGLHNITTVGGELRISISDIWDLSGLRSLRRVGKGLSLTHLTIAGFRGLEALTELGTAGGEPVRFEIFSLPVAPLAELNFPWHDAIDVSLGYTGVTDLGALAGVPELHGLEIVENDLLGSS